MVDGMKLARLMRSVVLVGVLTIAAALVLVVAQSTQAQAQAGDDGGPVVFLDPLDNSPLDVPLPEGDDLTDAVAQFHATGENLYYDDADAVAAGKKTYDSTCASCHLADATGRIGPNLLTEPWAHPRNGTDVGKFEMLWAGGAGAMQSFANRMSQDEMLQVLAYIHSLAEAAGE
jgi:cytochrome c(L)